MLRDRLLHELAEAERDLAKALHGADLAKLLHRFPRSGHAPAAHLAIADHYFFENAMGPARRHYEAVLADRRHPLAAFAAYKLGWVFFNLGEMHDAVAAFEDARRLAAPGSPLAREIERDLRRAIEASIRVP